MFSIGRQGISLDIPFDTICVDVEDQYTNLHEKILESFKHIHHNVEYDFLIKIDDDTLFNVGLFDQNVLSADYTGRLVPRFVENFIQMPALGIFQKLKLYPESYANKSFSFMPGDFYILSKRAVDCVLANIKELDEFDKNEFVAEDQLVGFLLRNSDVTINDIGLENDTTKNNFLQVTQNWMSIHPIMTHQFKHLSNMPINEQIHTIQKTSGKTSFLYRKMIAHELQQKLTDVLKEFLNSKKSSGMC
jgi:hypothetical protein